MAVKEIKVESSLILKLSLGETKDGKEKFKLQRFSKLKENATSQDIFELVNAMKEMLSYEVDSIFREDQNAIYQG